MKKEKTLYEKRISWHEEGISYNGKAFKEVPLTNGDKILREKDVKQFIKEILEEIENRIAFLEPIDKEMCFKIIKQKSGFKDLE